jgi:hypothetical protein
MPLPVVTLTNDTGKNLANIRRRGHSKAEKDDTAAWRELCSPGELTEVLIERQQNAPLRFSSIEHFLIRTPRRIMANPRNVMPGGAQALHGFAGKVFVGQKSHCHAVFGNASG